MYRVGDRTIQTVHRTASICNIALLAMITRATRCISDGSNIGRGDDESRQNFSEANKESGMGFSFQGCSRLSGLRLSGMLTDGSMSRIPRGYASEQKQSASNKSLLFRSGSCERKTGSRTQFQYLWIRRNQHTLRKLHQDRIHLGKGMI